MRIYTDGFKHCEQKKKMGGVNGEEKKLTFSSSSSSFFYIVNMKSMLTSCNHRCHRAR